MGGRAMFTDDEEKAMAKELTVVMNKTRAGGVADRLMSTL